MENPTVRLNDGLRSGRTELRPQVKKMQEALNKHGFPVDADGYFGKGTQNKVAQFQQQKGLSADGVVGESTWKALLGEQDKNDALVSNIPSAAKKELTGNELISRAQLEAILTNSKNLETYFQPLNEALKKYAINTPLRIVHFLAQVAHESGSFLFVEENLNYSAKALRAVFGKYFPDEATAEAYSRKPEKIANRVYADRMGNGNEASGDGWRFRGRGLVQLTGRDNYTSFQKSAGTNLTDGEAPTKVAEPEFAVRAAAWFWDMRSLNKYADVDDLVTITKRVNGGTHGLEDRKKYLERGKATFQI